MKQEFVSVKEFSLNSPSVELDIETIDGTVRSVSIYEYGQLAIKIVPGTYSGLALSTPKPKEFVEKWYVESLDSYISISSPMFDSHNEADEWAYSILRMDQNKYEIKSTQVEIG